MTPAASRGAGGRALTWREVLTLVLPPLAVGPGMLVLWGLHWSACSGSAFEWIYSAWTALFIALPKKSSGASAMR